MNMTPVSNEQKAYGKLVAKAWSDESFKKRLKQNPTPVLAEMGIEVPEGLDIEVVENTPQKYYLMIPKAPSAEMFEEAVQALSSLDRIGSMEGCSTLMIHCTINVSSI